MNDVDVREYIINNFKGDSLDDIKTSIDNSIASRDEDPLIGLGVLFELTWNNSSDNIKEKIVENIKKGLD